MAVPVEFGSEDICTTSVVDIAFDERDANVKGLIRALNKLGVVSRLRAGEIALTTQCSETQVTAAIRRAVKPRSF